MRIVADIESLIQHIKSIACDKTSYHPSCCYSCGKAGLWRHGFYTRKAERSTNPEGSLNPILIPRFYCPNCKKTCSALPECISPRRWYLWAEQQAVLFLILAGVSYRSIAQKLLPSRWTVARWKNRFFEMFNQHKNALTNRLPDLGRTENIFDFWPTCFEKMPLGKAMRICHYSGVIIP